MASSLIQNAKFKMQNDYSSPFTITKCVGNNTFSYDERASVKKPQLHIPALRSGDMDDIVLGDEIVFEEFADGQIHSHTGLKHFIHTQIHSIDTYVFDNHNHALYFWSLHHGGSPSPLVHIDQHSDMRTPQMSFGEYIMTESLSDLSYQEQVFHYTNFYLNIGNFIVPAVQMGIVSQVVQVTGSVDDISIPDAPYILDIDLDYFAPEMNFLDREVRMDFVRACLPHASVITIATSPYFIDQTEAIRLLREMI